MNPGADLGPFRGSVRGRTYDLVWQERWTVFLEVSAAERLVGRGVDLGRLVPVLAIAEATTPQFLEPEVIPSVRLAKDSMMDPTAEPCPQCQRVPTGFKSPLVLERGLPADVDIARARNDPALIFVSERFVEAARELRLLGFVAQPVST